MQVLALELLLRPQGQSIASMLAASTGQASSSPSWLAPVAGAVGVVLGACVAGVFGFASSWYTLRKQREFTELALEDQRVQSFNERFATAADKLGHGQPATRLAGVYALAGLADEWKGQQQVCIDVLCGYMRFSYEPVPGAAGFREGEREVRLSLIRIIRDHLRKDAPVSWQGRIFRFHRATFDGGDLSQIRISDGYMSFYDAHFVSGSVDFRGADFCGGTVDFQEAQLSGGNLDFRYARFSGGIVKFPDMLLSSGIIDFRKASFSGGAVDLTKALFSGGMVDLREPRNTSVPPRLPDPAPAQGLLP